MAITTFTYASQSDLKNYFNRFGDFDQKTQIFPTSTSSNLHTFQDTGYTGLLFINGDELAGNKGSTPNADGEWYYIDTENKVEYYDSGYTSTTIHNQTFYSGIDFKTFIDQQLVNASLELNTLLDARYSTPLQKNIQTGQVSTSVAEYDPIIIKATCYIAAANLIRSREPMAEDAQAYYDMVSNTEKTGLIDRLNSGDIKLSNEIDRNSDNGSVTTFSSNEGEMELIDLNGKFSGGFNGYDLLRIVCTSTGAYGVGEVVVQSYGAGKLLGESSAAQSITGGYDKLSGLGGLAVRFQGASMTSGDIWEIQAFTEEIEETNTMTNNIQTRRV